MMNLQENSNKELAQLYNLELRHIEGSKITKLSAIIDNSKDLDRLLEELTRPVSRVILDGKQVDGLKLSVDSINLIKNQIHCGKSPTMALLNHWSITGRRRPTVKTLLKYLQLCGLKRAEDFVCREILGLEPEHIIATAITEQDEKPLSAQPHDVMESASPFNGDDIIEETYRFHDLDDLAEKLSPQCERYSFDLIFKTTNKFCHKSGTKIGEGRFSSVYRAKTMDDSGREQTVAAKLLKSECNKAYLVNEINLIRKVNHENVLKFLGIALGKSQGDRLAYICLIYPYMENGSLLDSLAGGLPSRGFTYLNWPERVKVSTKLARGISYLHNFEDGPIVHRDVKTANILLDAKLEPKLGDFTIVRQLGSLETQYSQNIIGTSVYMPPEAFRGDISIKFDSFSFGIVLLELLTGMKPFNEEQNEDLLSYISERLSDIEDNFSSSVAQTESGIVSTTETNIKREKDIFLIEILDKKAAIQVDDPAVESECRTIFELAMRATESRKNSRPSIDEILSHLERLASMKTLPS